MFKKVFRLLNAPLSVWVCALLFAGAVPAAQSQGCSQPSNLNSNVLASGTVALSWSAIEGATSYTVQYRVGNSGPWTNGGTVATTNQVLTGLLSETVYTWRVKASCSTYSSIATFNTGGGVGGNTSCSSPSNLNATNLSPTSVGLSWSAIEGALYYTVQYRVGNSGAWTNAGAVALTNLTLNNLLTNTVYTWRVKASCSVYSSIATFNTGGSGGNSSCSQPSNLEALLLSNTSAELSWSAIQGAFNYTVQYRQGLSGAWLTAGTVTTTSLVLTGLQENTEYSWRVKASCSVYSSQAVFTTGGSGSGGGGGGSTSCSAPSNTNTDAVFPTYANVSWEPQGGASNYTVQYRLEQGTTYTTVGTFTVSSATITGLTPGMQYVWRVKANCSPYGSDVQFSTPLSMNNGGQNNAAAASRQSGEASLLRLFPNPATSDFVQVVAPMPYSQLTLHDITGKVIAQQNNTGSQPVIEVSDLRQGVYFVRLSYDDGTALSTKLIVVR
ncbi:MAG: fibronectin type III domain-containing protein [Saprospiraceae bacterium]|nr:fibronectin type III domain-containing protein [Saprospiraceae bacterium]